MSMLIIGVTVISIPNIHEMVHIPHTENRESLQKQTSYDPLNRQQSGRNQHIRSFPSCLRLALFRWFFLFLLGENYAVSRVLVAFKLTAAWVLEALFSTSLQDCHSTISGDWCLIKEEKLV